MLVPSIDLMNGKAVQLRQGKDFVLQSDRDPIDLAREFNRYGEVAVIDLDAALGKGSNAELIQSICKVADVRVGGGIRDVELGRQYLKAGAKRIIFGTMAKPEILSKFHPSQVMVALDHKDGRVVDKGWTESTAETVWERAERLSPYCGSFLSTFVQSEGCLEGMSENDVKELKEKLPHPVTVAGGISSTEEASRISKLGVGVQVGMALYTGKLDPVQTIVQTVNFNEKNQCPTVVQDQSGNVLMVAYSTPESLTQALTSGKGIYFSRSRNEIWEKGLTSGNAQTLLSCRLDCDRDTILFTVKQAGNACHRQSYTCFNEQSEAPFDLEQLFKVIAQRKETAPEDSYTTTLLQDRSKLLKKIMEEAYEVVSYKSRDNLRWEIADLVYFLSVLAVDEGIDWTEIESELSARKR